MVSETLKFKIFYFIRYFGDAFFYPFMSIYFISKGMSDQNLGIIFAITPITTILVNPFWNFLVKDIKVSRLILKIMTLIEGALIITLTQVSGFEMYALIVVLIAFFCSPFISIQDGFTATYSNINKIEYSSIRIYASIAYVIASAIAGVLIMYLGYTLIFIIGGVFFAVTTLVVFWLKPFHQEIESTGKNARDIKALLHNPDFYKYLLFYTLVIGAVRIGDSFFGVFITDDKGLSTTGYGFLYSGFVFVEVLTLRFLINKGQLVSEKNLLILANILFILRFALYGLDLPLSVLIPVTLIRGLSWGIVIFAHIKFIIKIVKLENVTTAILIITFFFSIFTAIGNFLFGRMSQSSGFSWPYLFITFVLAFGLLLFLVLTPKTREQKGDEIEALEE